jgi:predicted AlkP superfamily pyrophosphatase or phosphodiesterase
VTADWIAQRGWVAPEHGGACFASLPGTIARLLTGIELGDSLPSSILAGLEPRYERVVLVYFDAFGLETAHRHAGHPLLARAAGDGVFARLTSQFPSTTTVHMTTIHTGLPVGEHGLYEWFMLEPRLDRLISPLPFTFAGDGQGPLPADFTPDQLYPPTTFYETLAGRGVSSVVSGPSGLAQSPSTAALVRGAACQLGFASVGGGLAELAGAMAELPAPAYGFAYIEDLDTILHRVGPLEPGRTHVDAEITRLLDAIEQSLLEQLPPGTLLLVTSDHGMAPVSPLSTTHVNELDNGIEIISHLRTGAEPDNHPLAPAGGCRDLFLHAKTGHTDDLVDALRRALGEQAEVRRTDELVADGVFGPSVSQRLRDRLGDVVILPELGESVYWYTPGRFIQRMWGQHGGLTAQEMEIPLIALTA